MKSFADTYGLCLLLVHHTRKQTADDKFDMISGTSGLLGAADGAFLLQKEKRTANSATLEISGRDQQDQKLYLIRNPETLLWELERAETELWKLPPEPLLEKVAAFISSDNKEWCGSPTELVEVLSVDMKANALSMKLNINDKLAEKKDEFRIMADRIENFDNGEKALQNLDESIMNEPEYLLPEPPTMMSARSYKTKFVEPLISRLKSLISTLFARYFKAIDSYNRLNITNGNLYRTNERLTKINERLKTENETLKSENKDYRLLRKVFGHKQIDDLLEKARNIKGQKRENPRLR